MDVNETLKKIRDAVKLADSAPVMGDPVMAAAMLATAAGEMTEASRRSTSGCPRVGSCPRTGHD